MFEQTDPRGQAPNMIYPEPDFAVQLREDLPSEDARHVLSLFAGDLQRLSAAVMAAAQAGQGPALRRAAHALAGAAGAVGAASLEQICRAAMQAISEDKADLAASSQAIEAASILAALALARVQRELSTEAGMPSGGIA